MSSCNCRALFLQNRPQHLSQVFEKTAGHFPGMIGFLGTAQYLKQYPAKENIRTANQGRQIFFAQITGVHTGFQIVLIFLLKTGI